MDLQSESNSSIVTPEKVGNAFVQQYYHIVHQTPEVAYRFYAETSMVSRPGPDGLMTSVTTLKDINEKIVSLGYKDFRAEIMTADAQKSHSHGVMVVVTGSLMGKDNMKRNFTQSFFLAPQDIGGYFVLNDIFRYVEDSGPLKTNLGSEITNMPDVQLTTNPEPAHVFDLPTPEPSTSPIEEIQIVKDSPQNKMNNEKQLVNDKVDFKEPQTLPNDTFARSELSYSPTPKDTPKKSYASILSVPADTSSGSQVTKGNLGQKKVYVPTANSKVTPVKAAKQPLVSVAPPPKVPEKSEASNNIIPHENSKSHDEVEGYSVYIRNLPLSTTIPELEAVFKKFGPITKRGVQVISQKHVGHCFGFVEFQLSSSMEDAIKASPVMVGDREAVVEIKRTSRVGNQRGRFLPGRGGGFRNDGFRGNGNFGGGGGGGGYGRNDYNTPRENSGRGRAPAGRNGRGYHQQASVKDNRPIKSNPDTISA